MVYFASSGLAPAQTAAGPQSYQNPYYKSSCGCGSSNPQVTLGTRRMREGFTANGAEAVPAGMVGAMPAAPEPVPTAAPLVMPVAAAAMPAVSMCTLTAAAPPAGCCHPAPLHCDSCTGSYFRASEAYGS